MKKTFYFALVTATLFEVLNVFFIMPMPGSQEMASIKIAYFLYSWRWIFRIGLLGMALGAFFFSHWQYKWIPLISLAVWAGVTFMFNFKMSADRMFYQPEKLSMKPAAENKVDSSRLIIGIADGEHAKAYPIQFIGYHHQVKDSLGDKPVMITYCTVCRTGRVFEPLVEGQQEEFRLVGMDHFNAMFEDKNTRSWWRQVNGEAIAGKKKGSFLPEIPSSQMTLAQWLKFYPHSLIMQPDSAFTETYDRMKNFETGKSKGSLTRRDSLSWQNKSWVVGIEIGGNSKAFDWNCLQNDRLIQDKIGSISILLVLATDSVSFFAYQLPSDTFLFDLREDTLFHQNIKYNLKGQALPPATAVQNLQRINAYQEFWHSWRTFHPLTTQN
ncbi:MAG: DUF3179 domain-containing (seleno)protein [Bacteroidia bacterium]|nr:DUF3179 domain-containing (seleno)protein [Bacteroidia bacterium]